MLSARLLRTAVCALALRAFAQQLPASLDENLQRIFTKNEFKAQTAGVIRWVDGGTAYTAVETAPEGGQELVRYDSDTGKREVLVRAVKLPGGNWLHIDSYDWSRDRSKLLIFTNTKKVWRDNTRGDYYVLEQASGKLQKLGKAMEPSMLMFAKLSPDATRAAYVYKNNLWVEDLRNGRAKQLTRDGSETLINGTSDWVTEEELFLRDCFRWSPDGRHLAYWQFDTSGVGIFTLLNDTDELYPRLTRIPYPKVGTKNSAVRAGVVSAGGGKTKWLKLPGDPRDHYIPLMEWSGEKDELIVYQLDRAQNAITVNAADARSGAVRQLIRDSDDKYIEIRDLNALGLKWLNDGREFLWVSERDGWKHVYAVSRERSEARLITRGEYDAISVAGVDAEGGWLYFVASPERATERYLYRTRLDGSGQAERITPQAPGSHTYSMGDRARFALHTYSRLGRPPSTEVVRLPGHESARELRNNNQIETALSNFAGSEPEFFRVPAGAVQLDGWLIKPRSFDSSKKYPVLVYIYGEPGTAEVVDGWRGNRTVFHRALADAGYLVVCFDPRGTPAPRGREWRKASYGRQGVLASEDSAAALRSFAAVHPYVDLDRVAVWGWSGGGTSTLNLMFRKPELYRVGMAVAPVPERRLYDSVYEERYMGLYDKNETGYNEASAINFAEKLQGRLLLVHGSGDDNVHFQGTERLINRLVAVGKSFDMMVYPNRTHSINEGTGTPIHVYRLLARYLLEHLPAGPR